MQRSPPMVTYKYAIQTSLMERLYAPVRERHHKQVESLIIRNCQITKTGVWAFRYKGALYRSDQAPRGPVQAIRLHEELTLELDQMIEEQREIRVIEEPMVKGYITFVLNYSDNIEDYLLLFPQSLHHSIVSLALPYRGERRVSEDTAPYVMGPHLHCIQLIKERMVSNLIFQ
jgi:hypothetical protein